MSMIFMHTYYNIKIEKYIIISKIKNTNYVKL